MTKDLYPSLAALRQFVEVQRAGGIAAASRKLDMTQPGLSRTLKRLEDIVGTPLLSRHSRGAELTPAGETMFHHAERILLEYEHGLADARQAAGVACQEIRIAAGVVFAHAIIPAAIPRFEENTPGRCITVSIVPYEEIEEALNSRQFDIAAHGIPGDKNGRLTRVPLYSAERAILCSENHPLTQFQRPTLNDLLDYAFVAFSPDQQQMRALNQRFREARLEPPITSVETASISGALDLLRHGRHLLYGSSLLADFAVQRGLVKLPLDIDLGQYDLGISHLRDTEIDSSVRQFINAVKDVLHRHKVDGMKPDRLSGLLRRK